MLKVNTSSFDSSVNNFINYGFGFMEGIEKGNQKLLNELAPIVRDLFYRYVDQQARMNPDALHHVYEWNRVGEDSARLFYLNYNVHNNQINFTGGFLPSKSTSDTSDTPFVNKAEVMESGIGITIEPSPGGVLAFEDGGETVFSATAIYVDNPGGDEVAGSFGRVVEEFFDEYLTKRILADVLANLRNIKKFTGKGGRGAGIMDGMNHMTLGGTYE